MSRNATIDAKLLWEFIDEQANELDAFAEATEAKQDLVALALFFRRELLSRLSKFVYENEVEHDRRK